MSKTRIVIYSFIIIVLLSILGINKNLDKIYSNLAKQSYKQNNFVQAHKYTEKAFELGVKDYKLRDLYINSIINSPFDSDSQEKIINFLKSDIEDAAKFRAINFLDDFKRQIYRKYPQNYITQAVYNQKIMRWAESPITYKFINPQDAPEYFSEEIEKAFSEWETALNRQILFISDNNTPNIVIKFNPNNPADKKTGKYVAAYTVPDINLNKLEKFTVNFYTKDPCGEYYSQNQIYNTALHEIAHALGFMGHSSNPEDIMHPTKDSASIRNDERASLTEADINTLKLLYQIKPDITNDKASGSYTPFIVLGNTDKINDAKLKEAVSYIQKAPKISSGYIDLADSLVAAKDYEKAFKALKKALKLADTEETKLMIYYNMAVVKFYDEDYETSEKYLRCLMKTKDEANLHYLLAQIYAKQNKTNSAEQEYERLIQSYPDNIDYAIGLANLYLNNKKYFKARKVLKTYLKNNPSNENNKRLECYGILIK